MSLEFVKPARSMFAGLFWPEQILSPFLLKIVTFSSYLGTVRYVARKWNVYGQ